MKALIVVASSNKLICADIKTRKAKFIPKDYRARLHQVFASVDVEEFLAPDISTEQSDFIDFIERKSRTFDFIACIVDQDDYHLIEGSVFGLFTVLFNRSLALKNCQNYFFSHVGSWIKNFIHLAKCYARTHDWNKFLLPYRVFDFDGLSSLGQRLRDCSFEPKFIREVDNYIHRMNGKRCPGRKGGWRDKQIFYKDDAGVYFCVADEKHAEAEAVDHSPICKLEKFYRFGGKIAPKFHFNATPKRGEVFGNQSYETCHGPTKSVSGLTHINVFPNNFF
jgi:hypothetical protein